MPTINLRGTQRTDRYDIYNGYSVVFSEEGVSDTWQEIRPDRVRTRKPTGWLEPKGYSFYTTTERRPRGSYVYEIPSAYRYTFSGDLWPLSANIAERAFLPHGGMQAAAEVKALLALKNQAINLGVAFAEAQQTANLVGSTANRIGKAYNSFKRGQFRKGMNHLGASGRKIPNSWLEAQYAWKPLLSDVYGAAEALATQPRTNWTMTAKGSVRREEKVDVPPYKVADAYLCTHSDRLSGAFVRLDFIPGNVFLDSLTRVGMTNPLEVIWEKVPFSFVVDWFLPIGDWLSAMDATIGWEFRAGSCSILRRVKHKTTAAPDYGYYKRGKFSGSFKAVSLERTVYSSSPLPYPPRPKNPLSLGHMANGLSLLASAFGKR